MKRLLLLLTATVSLSLPNYAQDAPGFMRNSILHGLLVYRDNDYSNFLAILYNNEVMATPYCDSIIDAATKQGFEARYGNRGNMIDFILLKDSLTVHYHLWLLEKESEGELSITYQIGNWHSNSDNWMNPRLQSETQSKCDAMDDFLVHAKIIARLMKDDMFIPHRLSARLMTDIYFNVRYGANKPLEYLPAYLTVLREAGLSVETDGANQNITASNGRRTYLIIDRSLPSTAFNPTFEVTPKW